MSLSDYLDQIGGPARRVPFFGDKIGKIIEEWSNPVTQLSDRNPILSIIKGKGNLMGSYEEPSRLENDVNNANVIAAAIYGGGAGLGLWGGGGATAEGTLAGGGTTTAAGDLGALEGVTAESLAGSSVASGPTSGTAGGGAMDWIKKLQRLKSMTGSQEDNQSSLSTSKFDTTMNYLSKRLEETKRARREREAQAQINQEKMLARMMGVEV